MLKNQPLKPVRPVRGLQLTIIAGRRVETRPIAGFETKMELHYVL